MGGTYEPIDSVRGITNKSSGKMGLELAKQAYIRGANLTLVVANVSVTIPSVFDVINVETGEEMMDVILDLIPDFDIFISTAAVSDFKFNPDIFLVGFKAEFNISHDEMIKCARKQISDAGTDLVIANDISSDDCHFGSDKNEVLLVDDEVVSVPLASKKQIAKIIFDEISKRL